MSQRQESFLFTADVLLVPLAGVGFILVSAVAGLIGRLNFNGEEVSYTDEPYKFVRIVIGGVLIGLLGIGYGAIRFAFIRKRKKGQ